MRRQSESYDELAANWALDINSKEKLRGGRPFGEPRPCRCQEDPWLVLEDATEIGHIRTRPRIDEERHRETVAPVRVRGPDFDAGERFLGDLAEPLLELAGREC